MWHVCDGRQFTFVDSDCNTMTCIVCEKVIDASQRITPCQCETAGYCPRIGCTLNAYGHSLCRSNFAVHQQWTRENAPCLEGRGPEREPQPFRLGLGNALAWLLTRIGNFEPWPGCGCAERKAWLNRVRLWPLWSADDPQSDSSLLPAALWNVASNAATPDDRPALGTIHGPEDCDRGV